MTEQPMAYLNPEFLDSADARPIRILSEYLEPLRRFKDQQIQDTVVFFGSVGYTVNIGKDIDRVDTATRCTDPANPATCTTLSSAISHVEPGDSVNTSVGMGLSLNERTSVSLGFSFDYVFSTEQSTLFDDDTGDVNPAVAVNAKSDPLYVGSFQVGFSYQVSDNVGINLNFNVGATQAAPDFEASIRVPIRFDVF